MKLTSLTSFVLLMALAIGHQAHADGGGNEDATVMVHSSRSSGLVRINILNHRKIGVVTLAVMDAQGRTWYREEGKAITGELVRNLDKGMLPKGELTLQVSSRDLNITQRFVVE